MFEPLSKAIALQYEAFKSPQPEAVVGCEHCTTPQDLCVLLAAPREKLTAQQLSQYAFKAVTTMGSTADFRYFWPRLAELALNREFWIDSEVVFGKPVYAQHHTWPEVEQRAIRELAAALGQWLAAEELDPDDVDSAVCGVGLLMEGLGDPTVLLEPLLTDRPEAWSNLCGFIDRNTKDMEKKHRLANAFWENAPVNASAVFNWLQAHPRVARARYELARLSSELYGTIPPVPLNE